MARKKYDIELFLNDAKAVFFNNLNAKIDEINLEKQNNTPEVSDNFNILTINDSAWYLNHIPQSWSYPQFVVWGLGGISLNSPESVGAIQTVTVFFEIAIPDRGEQYKESTVFQLLRYSRALQEIAIENHDELRGYGKFRLDSLSPGFVDISGKMLRIAGINLTASFDV